MRALASVAVLFCAANSSGAEPRPADLPFKMALPTAPMFPARDFRLTDFGGVGDGRALNTTAFAKAIAACVANGGGRVLVPPGRWLTGAIHLKSNVNLHLTEGAIVLFSTDPKDYLPAVWVRWAGFECMNYSPLIYARDGENIAITGRGTLDGQGSTWWFWAKRQAENAKRLYRMTQDNRPVAERVFARPEDSMRPDFVQWMNCRNVLIEDITVLSGPFWTLHPTYCDGVTIRGVTIRTAGPNNDGLDVDSSRNVLIEGCDFLTGDDAIVLKSGINEEGRRINRPTENVVIRRCTIRRAHGGVAIGSEMSGGVRNVLIHDCDFIATDSGVRLKSARGRGSSVEHIWCRDLRMANITSSAFSFITAYRAWFGSDEGVAPRFRDIHVDNVAIDFAVTALTMDGLPEQAIEGVTFRNLRIVARGDIRISEARDLTFEDIAITAWEAADVFTLRNTHDVTIRNLSCAAGPETLVAAKGSSSGIRIVGGDLSKIRSAYRLEGGVAHDAVGVEAGKE